jgi:large subunit ribosomal protein L21
MSADYAIISTGGKQYRVRPGDTIEIEKLEGDAGSAVEFDQVLLTSVGGNVVVGKPRVEAARVTGEITSHTRGPKVLIYKYMAKTRRQRIRGHRQPVTTVKISGISAG